MKSHEIMRSLKENIDKKDRLKTLSKELKEFNKQEIISLINEEIKEIMRREDELNLQIVIDAVNNLREFFSQQRKRMKSDRPIVKLIDKHKQDKSLEEHDRKYKVLLKIIDFLNNIEHENFLKNGKYYLGN